MSNKVHRHHLAHRLLKGSPCNVIATEDRVASPQDGKDPFDAQYDHINESSSAFKRDTSVTIRCASAQILEHCALDPHPNSVRNPLLFLRSSFISRQCTKLWRQEKPQGLIQYYKQNLFPIHHPLRPAVMAGNEDVEFKTIDGLTIRGWLYPASKRGPAIIATPGVSLYESFIS